MPVQPGALLCFLIAALAPAALALAGAPAPERGRPALALFAPWVDAAARAESVGVLALDRGGYRGAALVWSPTGDHVARMRAAGAIAVLPADLAPIFCGAKA